jgi:hypothetical protein
MVRRRSPAYYGALVLTVAHRQLRWRSGSGGSVVTEVASYGKQLGWLTEIAIALAKREPLPEETLGRLEKATKDIPAIKEQVGISAADAANDALDRLERHDPTRYQRPYPLSEAPARTEECQIALNFNSVTSSICSPLPWPAAT